MAAISGEKPKGKPKRNEVELPPLTGELGEARPAPKQNVIDRWLYRVPWWALILALVGIWLAIAISQDEFYSGLYRQIRTGISVTIRVTLFAYLLALAVGLVVALIRSYPPKPQTGTGNRLLGWLRLIMYNLATMFVEVLRGLPIVVVLLVAAFVVIPAIKDFLVANYDIELQFRGASMETAIIALGMAYGAYISEIFRAGIQSIEKGQIEAARSLGMTNWQTMRLVVLPQAVRRVIPPLGNDFVAMIKDSSLVLILGVRDISQMGKVVSGSNFRYEETYLVVSAIYLTMTVLGSILVRLIERYLAQDDYG